MTEKLIEQKRKFVDEDTIPDHLKCHMCYEVFLDPIMDMACQHTFCKECILSWIKSNNNKNQKPSWPVCRKNLCPKGKLKRNLMAFQIINELSIHCSNHPHCPWVGTLDTADTHIPKCTSSAAGAA